ncbi:MAG: hypothetical protein QOF32_2346 [Gammaproteobacteria bacterium]|nr:hypothetical protein [Gammaproteobacteria bacterium]
MSYHEPIARIREDSEETKRFVVVRMAIPSRG